MFNQALFGGKLVEVVFLGKTGGNINSKPTDYPGVHLSIFRGSVDNGDKVTTMVIVSDPEAGNFDLWQRFA